MGSCIIAFDSDNSMYLKEIHKMFQFNAICMFYQKSFLNYFLPNLFQLQGLLGILLAQVTRRSCYVCLFLFCCFGEHKRNFIFLRKLLFFHLQFFLSNVEKALPFEVRRVQVKVFAVVSCGLRFLEKKTAKKDKHRTHTATDKQGGNSSCPHCLRL